jgi:carbonic anhydrase
MSTTRRSAIALLLIVCAVALSASALAQHTAKAVPAAQVWDALAAGNHRFVTGAREPRDVVARRKELTATQNPRAAVLSCADSRVPPEVVFDQGLGDLFVVRSAGESDDPLSIGSLEYAVAHLGASVIVIMGHQACGAVKAACSGEKAESPNLEAVVNPIASSCSRVDRNNPATFDAAARDHVHIVAEELLERSALLKRAAGAGKLTIVEAYYSLETGQVTRLR